MKDEYYLRLVSDGGSILDVCFDSADDCQAAFNELLSRASHLTEIIHG